MSMICAPKANLTNSVARQANIIASSNLDFLTCAARRILARPPFRYAIVMFCDINLREMKVTPFLFPGIDRFKPVLEFLSVALNSQLCSQIQRSESHAELSLETSMNDSSCHGTKSWCNLNYSLREAHNYDIKTNNYLCVKNVGKFVPD